MLRSLAFAIMVATTAAVSADAAAPRRATASSTPPVEPCDLVGHPDNCSSCPSLMAGLRLPGAPTGDSGLDANAIAWSPLYVAFRLNCLDAGQLLISRGANPERGGRQGTLLAEIAAQHFAVANPRPEQDQASALRWVALLAKVRPFDLDALIGDGMPNTRSSWTEWTSAGALPPGSTVIWSKIEALSANFPVLVEGGEWSDVDHPAPDTGITRPSETAMSRGVEAMANSLQKDGMIGVTGIVSQCWSTPRAPSWNNERWRWHLERCAAMDVAANIMDKAVSSRLNAPRVEFFLDDAVINRLQALAQNRQGTADIPSYMKALDRSVNTWLPIAVQLSTIK